jgi:hypothetical protein
VSILKSNKDPNDKPVNITGHRKYFNFKTPRETPLNINIKINGSEVNKNISCTSKPSIRNNPTQNE